MEEKDKKNWLLIPFLLSLAVAVGMVLYGGWAFSTGKFMITYGQTEDLNEGWYYFDNGRRVDLPPLPATVEDDGMNSLTICRTLPDSLPDGAALCIESLYQQLEVFIGDELVYENGLENKAPVGIVLSDVWNIIDLHESAGGQVVTAKLTSPVSPGKWTVSGILLGNKSAVIHTLWESCFDILVFTLLSGVMGALLLLLATLLKWKRLDFNQSGFFYLGLFILLSSFWILTDSKLSQFLFSNKTALYLASFLSFTLMPVPFMLFLRQLSRHGHRVLDVLSLGFILASLVYIILYLTGTADFIATLPFTHILMFIGITACIAICFREQFHYRNAATGCVLIGICILTVGALFSLLTFNPLSGGDHSKYFRYGLVLFFILLCYGSAKRGVELLRSSLRSETYRSLAYMDTMTGLGNRAAFDRDANSFQQNSEAVSMALVVLDINNLKYVNDSYGHMAGDILIKCASCCIQEVFALTGKCYRTGGDEFVIMTNGKTEKQIQKLLTQFAEKVSGCDTGLPEKLDIAHGYAIGNSCEPDFIYHLFQEADMEMYRQKGIHPRKKHP